MIKLLRAFRKHQPDIEALSEQIDGRLDPARVAELDAHVASCHICRDARAVLVEASSLLASMPQASHPQSFRLRQADVEAPVSAAPKHSRPVAMRWAPALAGVSAVVFVVVFGADIVTRDSSQGDLAALRSSEQNGMLAADGATIEYGAPAGAIAPPDTGTFVPSPAEGAENDSANPEAGSTAQADAARVATLPDETPGAASDEAAGLAPEPSTNLAQPTGPPPDGETEITEAPAGGVTDDADEFDEGSTEFVPPSATPALQGAVPPESVPVASSTPTDVEAISASDGDDGNRTGFLVVEITAAAVALLAGAAYVAWRWMRRGTAA